MVRQAEEFLGLKRHFDGRNRDNNGNNGDGADGIA